MATDLIISDHGKVMIARCGAFAGEVTRVDFDADSRLVTLNMANDDSQTLDVPVNSRMAPLLRRAGRILLVTLDEGKIVDGYDVPLTCIE